MIATFLRPPRGAAELFADALRLIGVLSVLAALIGWSPVDAAVFGLVMLGLVLPRFLGARPALDVAFGVALLVAAWSSVLDVYLTTRWWDIPVHLALNGLIAAVAYLLLIRLEYVPDPHHSRVPLATVTLTVALGLSAGVLWEIGEWGGHTFIDETIFVGYADSIGDLAVGGIGAVLAGLAGRYLTGESRFVASGVAADDPAIRSAQSAPR